MAEARVTQDAAQVDVTGETGKARVTQDAAQVDVTAETSKARITQDVAQVAVIGETSRGRITQLVAQVWVTTASVSPPVPPITPAPVGSRARVSNHPQPFRAAGL